jgi:tetratricopeptide (TPR) repeat protein
MGIRRSFAIPVLLLLAASAGRAAPDWMTRRRAVDILVDGLAALGRDDDTAASRAFRAASRLDPTDPRPVFLGGLIRLRREEPLEALAELARAAELVEATGARAEGSPARPLLLARAMALRALERDEEAREAEAAAPAGDDSVAHHLWFAWSLLAPGRERCQGARGAAIAALKAHPRRDDYLARVTLVAAYRRLGEAERALAQARTAARHPAARGAAYRLIADLHRESGARTEERRALEGALRADGRDPAATIRLAELDVADGRTSDALDRLAKLDDPPPRARWLRAWIRLGWGEEDAAVADLAAALAARPELGLPGDLDARDRRLRPATWTVLDEASARLAGGEEGPRAGLDLRRRGRARLLLGDFAKAYEDLDRALVLEPGHEEALRPLILGARVEAHPREAASDLEILLRDALLDERVRLGHLRLRAFLVAGRWTEAAEPAAELRAWIAAHDRDLGLQGFEPGSARRRELARRAAETSLLEARALLAAGKDATVTARLDEASRHVAVRAEALALRALVLLRRGGPPDDVAALLAGIHEPTRLRDRGVGHPLNGWVPLVLSEIHRAGGREEEAKKALARARREGLPAWAGTLPAAVTPAR